MRSIELFVGAGGLAMGTAKAGLRHEVAIEWDRYACDTIRENKERGLKPLKNWPLFEGDVCDYDFSAIAEGIDLVSGGPPCQPFSIGGKHRGYLDPRDMFPQAIRAVRELRPRAFLFENVRGLTRKAFANYLEYVRLQLTYPELSRAGDGRWTDHLADLQRYDANGVPDGLHYRVLARVLNAANYGVPQRRERVFIVGFRSDLGTKWLVPKATHSENALLWSQWVVGDYWDRHGVVPPDPARKLRGRINRLRNSIFPAPGEAWLTVRDALADLPDPEMAASAAKIPNHHFIPGARSYPGHTGSPLDAPAKTLKAGDHGVPGGENTLRYPDGSVRYFTVRESARLQTFPDDFRFHGSWTETMRQLGNAVPVTLAEAVAASIRDRLHKVDEERSAVQPLGEKEPWRQRRGGAAKAASGAIAA